MTIEYVPVVEAERTVVGVLLNQGGGRLDDIQLTTQDFSNTDCALVFDAICKTHSAGEQITIATVTSRLQSRYWDTVYELASDAAHMAYGFNSNVALIARNATYERALSAAETIKQAIRPNMDETEIVETVRSAADSVEGAQKVTLEFVGDILPSTLIRATDDGNFTPTSWTGLNQIIGGLRPGCLYVIGARPGVGKSVVAQGLAAALAEVGDVAFASLEMNKHELVQRIIAAELQIKVGKIKDGLMSEEERVRASRSQALLDSRIAIDDRAGSGISQIRGFVRAVNRRGHLAGVVVDYMQLMTSSGRMPRHEAVADFSRQLKLLAKEYDVPVIALAQLNRDSETSAGREMPRVSQLRESGAIEQDADVIILLHRESDTDGRPSNDEIILDVQKNRHGRTGYKSFVWQGGYSKISDYPVFNDGHAA